MEMKVIINNKENINIINKSKFIGIIKKVYTKDEITNILTSLKKEYIDATHICYAYILPNSKKYSDDKEPAGTAGKPILDILEKNDLCYIIAIVIRYFGGIKLGSNGLIHAYANTIKELILNNTKEKEEGYLIKIEENYDQSNNLDYLLKNSIILKKEYQEKLIIEAIIKEETLNKLSNINYVIIKKEIF